MHVHDSNLRQLVLDGLQAGSLTLPSSGPLAADRRQAQRYELSQKALMHTVYPVSSNRRVITVLDLSATGLGVQTILPELIGSSVRVQMKDVFVIGEVRHCREIDDAYHIGIRVEAVLYGGRTNSVSGGLQQPRIHETTLSRIKDSGKLVS